MPLFDGSILKSLLEALKPVILDVILKLLSSGLGGAVPPGAAGSPTDLKNKAEKALDDYIAGC